MRRLQADGGTRTAAINGAWVALHRALSELQRQGQYRELPLKAAVGAVSVGLLESEALVDLCYEEDSTADVDLNLVATDAGGYVEIQGTAEREPFTQNSSTRCSPPAAPRSTRSSRPSKPRSLPEHPAIAGRRRHHRAIMEDPGSTASFSWRIHQTVRRLPGMI